LLDQVKQLTVKEKQLRVDLDVAKDVVGPKTELLTVAEEEKRKAKAEHNDIREKQQKQLTNLKSRLASLKDLTKQVENFESRNLSKKLQDLKANVEKLTLDKDNVNTKKDEISNKTTGLQKDLASQNVSFMF